MFPPSSIQEFESLSWSEPDVVLVTGDAYIDSPFDGTAVIARVLISAGFRVAVISQPETGSAEDISRLGEPRLFWGVSGGAVDSMVANYTASGKKRFQDDSTPGGANTRRPDRAVIAYTNLIRRHFKDTAPVVIGGVEASLRRVTHYDFWSGKLRRSVLFDSKADILLYGMAERSIVALAHALRAGLEWRDIPGICYASRERPCDSIELPSHNECVENKDVFVEMFRRFAENSEPGSKMLTQLVDTRYLVQNPPDKYLDSEELDMCYGHDFSRDVHPACLEKGAVRAADTIRFSVISHFGCLGGCRFCGIAFHQGRGTRSRSSESILREVRALTKHPRFKGNISDVGGPTANMYRTECRAGFPCSCRKSCLTPDICSNLVFGHEKQLELLRDIRDVPGVKKVFIASGVRHDLVLADRKHGGRWLREIASRHVSGQLKVAPEHSEKHVLELMNKPPIELLGVFREKFMLASRKAGKKQFLTYYFIAAHPGSTEEDMRRTRKFAESELGVLPEQVQVFTPLPSTWSALIYFTEKDPFTGKKVFVEKSVSARNRQKKILLRKQANHVIS